MSTACMMGISLYTKSFVKSKHASISNYKGQLKAKKITAWTGRFQPLWTFFYHFRCLFKK